jgi:hypothetical protein
LSGANSLVGISGADLSATANQLTFNYAATDSGYALFQSPVLFTGSDFWCSMSSNVSPTNCPPPGGQAVNIFPDANQFTKLSAAETIGAASGVPEPSYVFPMILLGISAFGFRKLASDRFRSFTPAARGSWSPPPPR